MTTAATPGPQPTELLRRVRAWNVSAWRHGNRIGHTRSALDRLARLATARDGSPRPPVPDAGVHALADQLDVLIGDALSAGATRDDVCLVLDDLAADLGVR